MSHREFTAGELAELEADLALMEAEDPELARLGERARKAGQAWLEEVRPPLVVELEGGFYAWIHLGRGFVFVPDGGWRPIEGVDAPGIGGRVLSAAEALEVVTRIGRPTP